MSSRNSGTYLEKALEKELSKITDESFHWERRYDSKSARNFMPAQPADFFMCCTDDYGAYSKFLECKSVGKKTRRLPKFAQLPRMLRWQKAGIQGYVLVHFHELDELYLIPVGDLEVGKPPWVIDEKYTIKDLGEAVRRLI